jgi:hypothetical protein
MRPAHGAPLAAACRSGVILAGGLQEAKMYRVPV